MSEIRPADCSKLDKNTKNHDGVIIFWDDIIIKLFSVVLFFLLSLVTGPSFMSWFMFHVSVSCSRILKIFFYKVLTGNPGIKITPVWFLLNIWTLGYVMDTKFDTNVSNRILLHAAKCQSYSLYLFQLIGKQTRWGRRGKIKPPALPRPPRTSLGLNNGTLKIV